MNKGAKADSQISRESASAPFGGLGETQRGDTLGIRSAIKPSQLMVPSAELHTVDRLPKQRPEKETIRAVIESVMLSKLLQVFWLTGDRWGFDGRACRDRICLLLYHRLALVHLGGNPSVV